jgi:hypothetical protein
MLRWIYAPADRGPHTEVVMVQDVGGAEAREHDEGALARARRMAAALGDLLEQAAADAPNADRNDVRYHEALARTLADGLASLRERRAA